MGFCSSSTCAEKTLARKVKKAYTLTYEKGTGHKDNNTTLAGGLSVEGSDLVLDLLEGKRLYFARELAWKNTSDSKSNIVVNAQRASQQWRRYPGRRRSRK